MMILAVACWLLAGPPAWSQANEYVYEQLDVDGDGQTDLTFLLESFGSDYSEGDRKITVGSSRIEIAPQEQTQLVLQARPLSPITLAPLSKGASIGADLPGSLQWSGQRAMMWEHGSYVVNGELEEKSERGPWKEGVRYLGFRINDSGRARYGWVLVSIPAQPGQFVQLHDYHLGALGEPVVTGEK